MSEAVTPAPSGPLSAEETAAIATGEAAAAAVTAAGVAADARATAAAAAAETSMIAGDIATWQTHIEIQLQTVSANVQAQTEAQLTLATMLGELQAKVEAMTPPVVIVDTIPAISPDEPEEPPTQASETSGDAPAMEPPEDHEQAAEPDPPPRKRAHRWT
jgi:hypothetical protein